MRIIGTALLLSALWLLLSGLFKPLVLGFGAISVAITVFVMHRMDRVDGDKIAIDLKPVAMVRYLFWLLLEIAKSNWAVTKLILAPKIELRQHLFRIPYTQKTDLGQVIFANSITLTPGTITVETEDGTFLVHAVNYAPSDMDALADMDRRVTHTELARA